MEVNEKEDLANDVWFDKLSDENLRKWFKNEYQKSMKGGKEDER